MATGSVIEAFNVGKDIGFGLLPGCILAAIELSMHAERSARRPKPTKLALNTTLRTYLEQRLAGPAMFRSSTMPPSGRYLSFAEREEIALLRIRGLSRREIGRRLGRSASTISRELRRNASTRSGGLEYRDVVMTPRGTAVIGPAVPWKGRRHGRRKDRRWAHAWSPEQIARRLLIDFPSDKTMRIKAEARYVANSRPACERDAYCGSPGRAYAAEAKALSRRKL
jgi:hypothetical protein